MRPLISSIAVCLLTVSFVAPDRAHAMTYSIANQRGGNSAVIATPQAPYYAYDPSVIYDNGVYKMYWCGSSINGHLGDNILYAEASSLSGPWHAHGSATPNTYNDVFWSLGNLSGTQFDSVHTCDPSVIKASGTYYMYYTGAVNTGTAQVPQGAIGVASSPDGINWTRMNGGNPIFKSAMVRTPTNAALMYGVGEQSVTVANGWFYMTYIDTTGANSNPVSGFGLYVVRATDPLFSQNRQVLTASGFVPWTSANATAYILPMTIDNGYNPWQTNADLQFIPAWTEFLTVTNSDANEHHVTLFDGNFKQITDTIIPNVLWSDGDAVVSNADGHTAIMKNQSSVLVDVLRASTGGGAGSNPPNNIAWDGVDLNAIPDAPTGLSTTCNPATHAATSVWNASSLATSYNIQVRDIQSGAVANFNQSSPSLAIPGVYSQYSWSVSACDASGCSAATNGTNFSCVPSTGSLSSSAGTVIGVGTPTTITFNAAAGSGDTLQSLYINQSINGAAQTNVISSASSPDVYTFNTNTPGAYTFYGWTFTAHSNPYWYMTPNSLTVAVLPSVGSSFTIPTTKTAFVTDLYTCILGRQPDAGGLQTYVSTPGETPQGLFQTFFGSNEYLNRNTSNAVYVNQLYQCILFRNPDPGGYLTYMQAIQNGSSRGSLLSAVLNSAEYNNGVGPQFNTALTR